ncbi:MAG TPA: hypothetical protein VFC84_06090 [Desulfosporosinus sp.]|nr:hypothetical protein [Desulfosporosinus sp.]
MPYITFSVDEKVKDLIDAVCAAAYNSFRITSRSVLLNPCCFCCSIIVPEIDYRHQGIFSEVSTQASGATEGGSVAGRSTASGNGTIPVAWLPTRSCQ